ENPGSDAVVTVDGAANVTLRGLHLKASEQQHAVVVRGACEGLTLDHLRAEVPPDSQRAAIFLKKGPYGTAERPIVLRDLEMRGGRLGLVLQGGAQRPAAHVRVEGCRFTTTGVHIALHDDIADVALTRNLFVNGSKGVSLAVKAEQVRQLTVAN